MFSFHVCFFVSFVISQLGAGQKCASLSVFDFFFFDIFLLIYS